MLFRSNDTATTEIYTLSLHDALLISGFVFRRIERALARSRTVSAALWSNYSVWCLFAWLNGGEIVQMFHISTLVGAALSWILLAQTQQLCGALPRRARRRPTAASPATP